MVFMGVGTLDSPEIPMIDKIGDIGELGIFKEQAFEDLQYWVQLNPKLAKRLLRLLEETMRDPFGGLGKPEPLRGELTGWWSRRIGQEHRLIYRVEGNSPIVAQAGGHYKD